MFQSASIKFSALFGAGFLEPCGPGWPGTYYVPTNLVLGFGL